MPPEVITIASDFVREFPPTDDPCLPAKPARTQLELTLSECRRRWVQTTQKRVVDCCADEICHRLPINAGVTYPEIVFLTARTAVGREVVMRLEEKGIRVVHTFDKNNGQRRHQKAEFFLGQRGTRQSYDAGELQGAEIAQLSCTSAVTRCVATSVRYCIQV